MSTGFGSGTQGQDLGTIRYNVEVDYSALIAAGQAQKEYTQETNRAVQDFSKFKFTQLAVTKEYRNLRSSIDPAYKAQQEFRTGAEMLKRELRAGGITLSQYNRDMQNLRLTTQATAKASSMFRNSMGSIGGIAQQAGFQVGDFATQVASGQSAMVAFTQQAPQFVGAFGPGGAVLGAVIAIGGAVATGLVRAFEDGGEEARTLSERIKEVAESVDELTEAQQRALRADFFADNASRLQSIIEERERIKELTAQIAENERLMNSAPGQRQVASTNGILGTDTQGLISQAKSTTQLQEETRDLRKELDAAQASIDTYFSEADKLNNELDEFINGTNDAKKEQEQLAKQLNELVSSTTKQAETLGYTNRELALYEARLLGAGVEEIKAINRAYDAIEAEEARQAALQETASLQTALDRMLGKSDPLEKFRRNWEIVQAGLQKGLIDESQAQMIMDDLVAAGEDAGKEFVNEWQDVADSVAQSLQDAIASGDWSTLGEAIGNTMASSVAGIVNKTITDSLAKNLTADSSMLAQIGGAFAGPIAGAVVGGAIQLAMSELSDYFGDDWDPTEARQARQGTGTVLGSINAKSESIANAVEISADATSELVGINRSMLRALESVQMGIEGATARVARGYSGAQGGIAMPEVYSGGGALSLGLGGGFEFAADMHLDYLSYWFTAGLVDFGKLIGGKAKKRDEGIRIVGGYISDLIDDTLVQAYATFRVRKHALDDYDTKERYQDLNADVRNQFSLVFESIYDSVGAGLDVFGMDIDQLAKGFTVDTQKLSLEGLDAAAQQAEIEAYFGTVFDNLAAYTIPWLDEFQSAGEGLGETLARVATQTQTTQYAIDAMGIRFDDLAGRELVAASERLIELGGGLEQFISGMQSFIGNFATQEQQFELNQRNLNKAMAEANLLLPETRQGYYDLLRAQNGATQAGAENIATLLRLQGTADAYYSALEEGAEDAARAAEELTASLLGLADGAFSALQRAVAAERSAAQEEYATRMSANQLALDAARAGLNAIEQEVRGIQSARESLAQQYDPMAETLRRSALSTLRNALATGDLTGAGEAAGLVGDINPEQFSTREDYLREQGRTLNLLGRLDESGTEQLTNAEMAVRALERQTDAIEEAYRDEMARLDKILEDGRSQIDALNGINSSVLTVAEAISQLAGALNVARPAAIEQAYADAGRTSVDAEGMSYWQTEIAAGRATIADLEYALWLQSEGAREFAQFAGLPQFADGGIASGPTSGYPVTLHGTEAVIPLDGGAIPLKMSSDKALLEEIAQLRRENGDLMKQLLTKTAAIEDYTRTLRNLKREEMTA